MFQQRISAHTHRRRRNTLLGAEDNAVAEWWYQLSAKLKAEIPAFLYFLTQRELSTTQESRMWFNPRLTHTRSLAENNPKQPQPTGNRNDRVVAWHHVEHERGKRIILPERPCNLAIYSQVKVEKYQVRKVVQEVWKLTSAHNSLSYTAYEFAPHRECHYEPKRKTGRFYTVTKRTTDRYLIILMKWWIWEVTYCLLQIICIHQTLINNDCWWKKTSFFFGKQSDEKKMNRYNSV